MPRHIELLAPAKNTEIGIEAIRHGADAVYIGATQFGARSAAGNSVDEISKLCQYAHLFGARVYVTLNTILYDDELEAARSLVWQLYEIGVDALIVQDLALLRMDIPPIALHASTQMDIASPERAQFLEKSGFSQLVMARELSLQEISSINNAVNVPLEAFIHGALCVSYSGRCYASQYCFNRSANRGRCAHFCRLKFDLIDADGKTLIANRHLLSLRDMNRTNHLEELLKVGVSSFKIEGRLKDISYVKNVTAHYRRKLDSIISRHPDLYCRSSHGTTSLSFNPNPEKSFNRTFTDYFLHKRTKVANTLTPKSMGQQIGKVAHTIGRDLYIETSDILSAGDGLCFINNDNELQGFRINSMKSADHAVLSSPINISPGTLLYRNLDLQFDKLLSRQSAERRIDATFHLTADSDGFTLTLTDEMGITVCRHFNQEQNLAQRPQAERLRQNLMKTGESPFHITEVILPTTDYFLPASTVSEWRRTLVKELEEKHLTSYKRPQRALSQHSESPRIIDYHYNVANQSSLAFYREHGAENIDPAYELSAPETATLMTCRHCILFDNDHCLRRTPKEQQWNLPLSIRMDDGRTFPLSFNCQRCEMQVLTPEK